MHGRQSLLRAALAAAVLVVGATASADPKDDKRPSPSGTNGGKDGKDRGRHDGHGWSDGHENEGGHGERTRERADGGAAGRREERQEREEADDALRTDESTEAHEKRKDYLRKSKRDFEAIVKPSGRPLSQAETEVIKTHWRRTMRLWRIRSVAEKAKDSQSIAKVDTLLMKAHEVTKAKLQELRATEGGGTK